MPLVGAHMPAGKGLGNAVRSGQKIGCNAVQVFTSSPQMWHSKPITNQMVEDLKVAREETGISALITHDSYLINLCAPNLEIKEKSYKALLSELGRSGELGIPYVVSHMGAHMGQGEEEVLKIVAEQAKKILTESPDGVTLLMETTAGQGSSLNYLFEHLARILELAGNPDRLAVCLDTCHIFAAGYDIRTAETYESTFDRFNQMVGLDKLKVIHVNDSKKELGKRVDRHDHIGEGLIGEEAFRLLMNDPRFASTPLILETPDAETMHEVNLKKLLSLVNH